MRYTTLHTSSEAEAGRREAIIKTELLRSEFGILDTKKTPTLLGFDTKLKAHLKANVAPRTYGFYVEHLKVLNNYGQLSLTKLHRIDAGLIEKFIQWRLKNEVSVTTVNHSLRTLRRALRLAREWNLIRTVPPIKLLPGEVQREFILTDGMIENFCTYCRKTYPKTIFPELLLFLVDTGLRITEACNLKREHITYEDVMPVRIRIVKGKSKYAKRSIKLTERAALALVHCLNKSKCEYAFTSTGGKQGMTRHYPSELFRTIRDALHISGDCVLHSTRHTYCTRLGKGGASASTIQKLAGHSSITISQRYVHPDTEQIDKAVDSLETVTIK